MFWIDEEFIYRDVDGTLPPPSLFIPLLLLPSFPVLLPVLLPILSKKQPLLTIPHKYLQLVTVKSRANSAQYLSCLAERTGGGVYKRSLMLEGNVVIMGGCGIKGVFGGLRNAAWFGFGWERGRLLSTGVVS